MSNTTLPPAPYQSPMVDKSQKMTPPWVNWFRQLFIQTGGSSSTSLASLIITVATLNATVATLQTNVSVMQDEIDGLEQGRVI